MQTNLEPMEMDARTRRHSALMRAHALIDWEDLRVRVVELYRREVSREVEQKPVDALVMFKAVLLGQWHSLSDPKLEEALRVRSDFMHFCGLGASDNVPDETTLRRFRNRLITSGRLAGLLAGVNIQLRRHGVLVKGAHGMVIDTPPGQPAASFKPDMRIKPDTVVASKVNEGGMVSTATISSTMASYREARNIDPDATWIKSDTLKFERIQTTPREKPLAPQR
ncbi:MAG: transposase [Nitrosospira sp.]